MAYPSEVWFAFFKSVEERVSKIWPGAKVDSWVEVPGGRWRFNVVAPVGDRVLASGAEGHMFVSRDSDLQYVQPTSEWLARVEAAVRSEIVVPPGAALGSYDHVIGD